MCDCVSCNVHGGYRSRTESASLSDKTMLEVAKILLVNHADERQMYQSTFWAQLS